MLARVQRPASPALALLALAYGLACGSEVPRGELAGARLEARVEGRLRSEQAALEATLVHQGLVFPVEQDDLLAYVRPIRFYGSGGDIVLGVDGALEPHGGGVLRLLFDHWRPGGRPARLTDRFRFAPNVRALSLGEIYRAHREQIFLPVPGRAPETIDAVLPDAPQLPRMRLPLPWPAAAMRFVETDAYKFLSLLVELEPDPSRPWTNQLGQRLSVELLLGHAREHYLTTRDTPAEPADHSNLHLVELLLSWERRWAGSGAEAVQRHFLDVELARTEFDPEDEALLLGHYTESLGHLVAHPGLEWTEKRRRQVRAWLTQLEENRFVDLAGIEVESLAHLLHGLRSIRAHRSALE